MNILYWICFCFIILQAILYFYRMLKNGLSDCTTTGEKLEEQLDVCLEFLVNQELFIFICINP